MSAENDLVIGCGHGEHQAWSGELLCAERLLPVAAPATAIACGHLAHEF